MIYTNKPLKRIKAGKLIEDIKIERWVFTRAPVSSLLSVFKVLLFGYPQIVLSSMVDELASTDNHKF